MKCWKIHEFIEESGDIKLEVLLKSDLNAWHKEYNGKEWIEEDIPKTPLIVAIEYFKGRVVGFGSISLFSSLSREYGFYAYDNDVLIGNILRWLIEKDTSEKKVLTISINRDLYQWADKIVKQQNKPVINSKDNHIDYYKIGYLWLQF